MSSTTSPEDWTITIGRTWSIGILWTLVGLIATAAGGAATVLYRVDSLEGADAKTEQFMAMRIQLNEERYQTLRTSTTRLEAKMEDLDRRGLRIEDKLDRLLLSK